MRVLVQDALELLPRLPRPAQGQQPLAQAQRGLGLIGFLRPPAFGHGDHLLHHALVPERLRQPRQRAAIPGRQQQEPLQELRGAEGLPFLRQAQTPIAEDLHLLRDGMVRRGAGHVRGVEHLSLHPEVAQRIAPAGRLQLGLQGVDDGPEPLLPKGRQGSLGMGPQFPPQWIQRLPGAAQVEPDAEHLRPAIARRP